jgi:glycosyltransferase involved in cell wall biosynthesis
MKKISVVMPCLIFNNEGLELTKAAIASLGDVNLIIVDDASPIGGGYLRSVADTYVRNKERSRFGPSVNKGLRLAGDGLIAIVNNDIIVSPNWQEVAVAVLRDKEVYSCHLRMTDYDTPFKYGDKIWKTGKERWCQFSFFIIDGAKGIQYFDEKFKHSYDDWEYGFRTRKNYNQAYTNMACFKHNHSFTRRQMQGYQEEELKDREYFKSLYGGYPEDLFAQQFPEQMQKDWRSGFDEGIR